MYVFKTMVYKQNIEYLCLQHIHFHIPVYRGYSRNRPKGGPTDYFMHFFKLFWSVYISSLEISSRKVIFVLFCANSTETIVPDWFQDLREYFYQLYRVILRHPV